MNYTEVQLGHAAHQDGLGISDNPFAQRNDFVKANRWLAGYIQRIAVTKPTTSGVTAHKLRLYVDLIVLESDTEVQYRLIEAMQAAINRS